MGKKSKKARQQKNQTQSHAGTTEELAVSELENVQEDETVTDESALECLTVPSEEQLLQPSELIDDEGSSADQEEVFEAANYEEMNHDERENSDEMEVSEESDAPPPSLTQQLTALLFVAPRPLPSAVLAEYTNHDVEAVESCLAEVMELFAKTELGFELVEVAGAYQLRTVPRLRKVIENLIPPRARKLSRAAAETLAVVAYKQPVQRAEIEAIRGVDALPTVRTLLDAKLIRVVGREDAPGQPALYGTTAVFLEKFGLRDLSELPPIREIVEISREEGEADGPLEDAAPLDEGREASDAEIDSENDGSLDAGFDAEYPEAATESETSQTLSSTNGSYSETILN